MEVTSLTGNRRPRQVGDFAVLAKGRWRIVDDDLPYDLELTVTNESGTAECAQLLVQQRDGGPAVTTEGIRRVKVATYVAAVGRHMVFRLTDPAAGIAGGMEPIEAPDLVEVSEAVERERTQQRRRITDDDLRRVASLVRVARQNGLPYIPVVMDTMRLTSDQARQWKAKAVQAGYLEEPR